MKGMMYKTHVLYGFLVGLLCYNFFEVSHPIIFFLCVMLGTLLPDIDNTHSIIGKKVWPLSLFLSHRGFFHSVFAVILLIVVFRVFSSSYIMLFGFVLGYVSHIVMDALTHSGIRPFYPLLNFRVKGFMKTNSFSELVLFVVLVGFVILDVYYKAFIAATF